ncbi:MAG TPA: hypothetical protein VGQ10_20545 [Vicinamibacterales bacterium]|jgi:hypothetical protein|nr:hypothetical protein [Vicinamibacterales bacterium]
MAKGTARNGSRRAFLTGAGGLAAALVAAPHASGKQAQARSASQPRDRGIWATWYDLPDAGRNDYLAWVHGTYIPALLKRPGYLWAAHYANIAELTAGRTLNPAARDVPAGNAYILVVGAEDTGVLGNPVPEELHAALSQEDRKMLAMRTSERTNVFAEASRITGPGAKDYKGGMTLAPCIQFGSYNIDYKKEVDILAWYAQLQMPNMSVAPGCVRTRRLASVSGWAKMGILYEFASVDLRNKTFGPGRPAAPPHKWQSSVRELVHAPGSPNVARRIWPGSES